jgi:hypothetical protein
MNRMTPTDRDRAVRAVSLLTGGLAVAAVSATGITTAMAAHGTQQDRAAHAASAKAAAKPAAKPAKAPKPATHRKHRVSTAASRPASTSSTRSKPKPRPKPAAVAPAPPPPASRPTPAG